MKAGNPIPPIAIGCEQLGGHEWGNLDLEQLTSAIHSSQDKGLNLYDTADCYGNTLSETRLGQILDSSKSQIISKFGVRIDESGRAFYDNSIAYIDEAITSSLERLQREYLDYYFVHYYDGVTNWDSILEKLASLKRRKKIRFIGVSNLSEQNHYIYDDDRIDCMQVEFSLANRSNEKIIRHCLGREITCFLYGPLGQGILSGKYTEDTKMSDNDRRRSPRYKNFHGDHLSRNLKIVEKLKHIGMELDAPPAAVAIAWVKNYLTGVIPIVGIKSSKQLSDTEMASKLKLTNEHLEELDQASSPSD